MIRYNVCNLEHSNNFSIENITFTKVTDYDKRKSHLYNDDPSDQWTFNAEVIDKKIIKGSKLNPGGNNNCVNDIMILLSIAQSRNIYFWKAEDISDTNTKPWGMLGGNRKASGGQVIMEHEIENYLNISLTQIRKTEWLEETGFVPAAFWWLESIYKDRPIEIKFPSGIIALEILANYHANTKFIKNSCVRTRIEALAYDYQWSFMEILLIKDWVEIRNEFMHGGSTKRFESKNSKNERNIRYFQLVYSVQIALIDLLGFTKFHQRAYWINTIQKPPNTKYKPIGPQPLISQCLDRSMNLDLPPL